MFVETNQSALLFPTAPEERVYIHHTGCRQATGVDGHDFVRLCDPLEIVPGTMCSICRRAFAFKNFRWADTNEVLSDYRKRLKNFRPQPIKQWYKSGFWIWGSGLWIIVTLSLFLFVPAPKITPEQRLVMLAVASVLAFPLCCLTAWEVGRQILRKKHPFDYRRVR